MTRKTTAKTIAMEESIITKRALIFLISSHHLVTVFGRNTHFYCQRGLVSGLAASELRDLTYKDTSDEGYECHHDRRLTDESTVSSPDDN